MPSFFSQDKASNDRYQLSLKLLLIVPFVTQVIAAVGVTGWLSIQNGREATQELAPKIGLEVTNAIETHVRGYFHTPLEVLQTYGTIAKAGKLNFENIDSLDELLWQQMRQSKILYFFYATNPQGEFMGIERRKDDALVLHRSSSTKFTKLTLEPFPKLLRQKSIYRLDDAGRVLNKIEVNIFDAQERPWYRGAVKSRHAVWSPIYLFVARPILGITASMPIYGESGNLRGVLAIDLTLSQIGDFLRQLTIAKTGQAFILEPSGDIVATSTSELPYISDRNISDRHISDRRQLRLHALQSQNPLLKSIFQNLSQKYPNSANIPDHQQIQMEWEGSTQYIQISRLRSKQGLDWLLIVTVSEQDFRDRIDVNTRNTVMLCALALVFASLTGLYTSKWIAKPVQKLIDASHLLANLSASADLASGQPYHPIETANVRELSILADSFNQMAEQLQISFMALAKSNEELESRVERRTEALRVSEAKYRTLVEVANCIILRRDTKGKIKFLNEYGLTFFGFSTEDEVVGKNIEGTIFPVTADPMTSNLPIWMNASVNEADLYMFQDMFQESQNTRSDGMQVWISWSNRPIVDEEGNMLEILSIGVDITERKRIESTLEQFLSLQRATFESIADGILAVDRIGHITSYNQQFVDMFALSQEVLSLPDYALRLEFLAEQMRDPQDFMQRSQEFYHHPEMETYDVLELVDGRVVERYSRPQKLGDQIIGRVWSFQDITARVQAEKALEEQKTYLRLIIDSIPQQIFWKDTNLVFRGCNKNWARYAQLDSPESVVGKTDYDLIGNPQLADIFRQHDRQIMESNIPELHVIQQKLNLDEDGQSIWLDISKLPIIDADGKTIGILGVLDDITERKRAEEALYTEQEKSERLLLNILPKAIADRLKQSHGVIADSFESVTVLFADIVSFTEMSSELSPQDLVDLLNLIFSGFDQLSETYGLEKIKTIGDAYMVAGGIPISTENHAEAIASMALDMVDKVAELRNLTGRQLQIRVGIHTGAVIAGVIGTQKFIYDLWGDTVNVASRMESHSEVGKIQVSAATYEILKHKFNLVERGAIEIKGKGQMQTYWLGKKL
ncbi:MULTISPECIES: adenylate/guanylate cyclase domain-containing protein [Pseudanabaena]|uniref:Adenylate cyclase n=2 Tax=Pseudanabaena TaxID=1152 RepID=L8N2B8_9CYAN|nr:MULTISPECIES: adenylate/guanylate cyclase domain-containing protein [Pseudanabaena]ELS33826.1 adenylate/guanylate cyclase with integral membrane sensor [Pseudanabaena biceps PCC 7429]MDG3493986.1 adenylate/guanylate cyclase domain-containing protein [Pseudanabaena catenata USMAC16]